MKTIGVITFHQANNYGAVLQAYALCSYLNSIDGVSAEVINYQSSAIEKRNMHLPFDKQTHLSTKNMVKGFLNYRNIKTNRAVFDSFRKRYLPLSTALSKQQLSEETSKYDILICGSDQIWNLDITEADKSYFLDFSKDHQLKYSYAASVGESQLVTQHKDFFNQQLAHFQMISVREESLVNELEQVIVKKARKVLDPVFLLDSIEWRRIATDVKRESYILVFKMGTNKTGERILSFAKELAQEKGLKVILLSDKEVWYKYRDYIHFGVATPEEFIGLINNAEIVVTNSFHATAFSLILNKEFYVDTQIPRAERIKDLLNLCGLEAEGLTVRSKDLNWNVINDKLYNSIIESKAFLQQIVSDVI